MIELIFFEDFEIKFTQVRIYVDLFLLINIMFRYIEKNNKIL